MNDLNTYISNLDTFYHEGTSNHEEHNDNPNYFTQLLKKITSDPKKWENKNALDFGCGKGRNVINLNNLTKWKSADGVDISTKNIKHCKENNKSLNSIFFKNNGLDLKELKSNYYDFVMSTIVFQHIPSREVRLNLKKEIYRILKEGGNFSFQMGHGDTVDTRYNHSSYKDNAFDKRGSNGMCDVQITPETENILINDLANIGFKNIEIYVTESFSDNSHQNWIYIHTEK
jgi:SAM-dependent methyltransferase